MKHWLLRGAAWLLGAVMGRYDAARRSIDRSHIYSLVQDGRFDADSLSRWELVRLSRHFESNNPIANRMADVWEQYTVGSNGLRIGPASSDLGWNARMLDRWNEWCEYCDIASRWPFATFQSQVARRWFFDGEVFILLTNGGAPHYRPRVQLIECHRVQSPGGAWDRNPNIHDGIEVDRNGRPVAYHIRDTFAGDTFRRVPAEFVVHVCEPDRAWQLRGVPIITPSMVDLHDLEDLQILEKRVMKKIASIAAVFKRRSGELPAELIRRQKLSAQGQTHTGAKTEEDRERAIHEALGGESVSIYPDEAIEAPKMDRPSLVQREYWDYLVGKACIGAGIPKILVVPQSMQGTVVRADLDVEAGFFRARSAVLQAAFVRVFDYVRQYERTTNPALADIPGDWRKVTVRAPRAVNVDVGRNSKAMLAELDAGVRTYESIYAELGEDWMEQLRQKAKERAFIQSLATEFGVEPDEIAKSAAEQIQEPVAQETEPAEVAR